jgi:hypothetical protein
MFWSPLSCWKSRPVAAVLSPPDETLRRQLVERREQLAQDRQWREQRLDRAAQWARDGRLRSALGLVEPLEAEPEAARRRRDWQFDLETLERYGREFEHHLQANELTAASAVLAKANQLAPLDPKVSGDEASASASNSASQHGSWVASRRPAQGLAATERTCIGHDTVRRCSLAACTHGQLAARNPS